MRPARERVGVGQVAGARPAAGVLQPADEMVELRLGMVDPPLRVGLLAARQAVAGGRVRLAGVRAEEADGAVVLGHVAHAAGGEADHQRQRGRQALAARRCRPSSRPSPGGRSRRPWASPSAAERRCRRGRRRAAPGRPRRTDRAGRRTGTSGRARRPVRARSRRPAWTSTATGPPIGVALLDGAGGLLGRRLWIVAGTLGGAAAPVRLPARRRGRTPARAS